MEVIKNPPSNLSIEASAGSGKTYRLAERFLELLSLYLKAKQKATNPNLCSANCKLNVIPNSIDSIIAITFTNKAAAEMKERVISFLKSLADIQSDNAPNVGLDKDASLKMLIEIIENFSDFHITTIDSFMNRILKAFSVDLNIHPDYEITFDRDAIFDEAFETLVSDRSNAEELLDFLKRLLLLSQYEGMNPKAIVKKGLKRLEEVEVDEDVIGFSDLTSGFNIEARNLEDVEKVLKKRAKQHVEIVKKIATEELAKSKNRALNKTFAKTLTELTEENLLDNYDKLKKRQTGESKIFNNNKTLPPETEKAFNESLNRLIETAEQFFLIKGVYETEIIREQLNKLNQLEEKIKNSLNIVEISTISKDISSILRRDMGVSYAFCRLGERISHYLIDEFQDTSHSQFEAMEPLIDNTLAGEGSVFVVGDKKQAIYAWRGGDYTIFDRITSKRGIKKSRLKVNYRSEGNIVSFNNRVFKVAKLLNEDFASAISKNDAKDKIKNAIIDIYKYSYQKINKEKNKTLGYIEIKLADENAIKDNEDEFYRKSILKLMDRLINKFKLKPSQIMILIRQKENIKKVFAWLKEEFPGIEFITEDSLTLTSNIEIKKLLLVASALAFEEEPVYRRALELLNCNIDIDSIVEQIKGLTPYEVFVKLLSLDGFDSKNNKVYFDRLLEEVLKLTEQQKSLQEIIQYFYDNPDITITLNEEVEAVRIMTIHKAKGLESHTVVVPFYDWSLFSYPKNFYRAVDLSPILKDKKAFLNLDSKIRLFLDDAAEQYTDFIKTQFIEALNLMYVANTRAKENLFIIGTFKNKKSSRMTSGDMLDSILKAAYPDKLKQRFFLKVLKLGELKKQEEDKRKSDSVSDGDCGIEQLPKRVSISREFLKVYPKETFNTNIEEKRLGNLYHLAMSFIGSTDGKNIDEAAEKAYQKAKSVMGYENPKAVGLIKNTLEDLRDYFEKIESFHNEKEFVDSYGNILRPDRITTKNGQIYIIDFKSGKKENEHIKQIEGYVKLFKKAKGIIYYADEREIVHVG
ncbi:UvrD-helicase domain-containing protein [Hippea sp. KM1]|uniref:UvrD-helicase domain-containing protein n=1 Tax=Hippea sp. KM1 TaxID=944481 RepID=UPI00046D27DC|nr:UvrD-helicase domain-containing protein [Hippea sp. KM1]